MDRLAAVVLAAGEGKRFKSSLPKVLHPIAGRPMIWHVLSALVDLGVRNMIVVTGRGREQVEAAARGFDFEGLAFATQEQQLGTAHALAQVEAAVPEGITDLLVLPGDTPLLTAETLRGLSQFRRDRGAAASLLTANLPDPRGYGRIIRNADHELMRIVEEADATADERAVHEINTGIYCFDRAKAFAAIAEVRPDNAQGEYYLTDVPAVLREWREHVFTVLAPDERETRGVNTRGQLAEAAEIIRSRIVGRLMDEGVTFVDPSSAYLDVDVEIGADTTVLPNCYLEKGTRIGSGCTIGPNTRMVGALAEDGSSVTYSVVVDAQVGPDATVGPFSYLRPKTRLEKGSKAGSFVELKNTHVGAGSKVPHLSYMGDTEVGAGANVGAGSITCNYDGYSKHRTRIGDAAFIGSDTMLVAPVEIGKGAITGAGSTITRDVPPGALGIERAEQQNIEGYAKRRRARKAKDGE